MNKCFNGVALYQSSTVFTGSRAMKQRPANDLNSALFISCFLW
jgi:5-enolpyruvylshikimate-3-phosphate synthase